MRCEFPDGTGCDVILPLPGGVFELIELASHPWNVFSELDEDGPASVFSGGSLG